MKKQLSFLVLLLVFGGMARAQSYEFTDVKHAHSESIKAINNGDELVGYISVMYKDAVNREDLLYGISIFDTDLKQTHYKEIVLNEREVLVSQAFNGNSYCLAFMHTRQQWVNYVIYDLKLEEIGRYKAEDLHPSVMQYSFNMPDDDKLNLGTLLPVPNKGYIRQGYKKVKGFKASVQMFSNSGEILWTSGTGVVDKMHEEAETYFVGENFVLSNVISRKSASSSHASSYLVAHNLETGEEVYRVTNVGEEFQMLPYDASYNPATGEYFVLGEYYKASDNLYAARSLGFYVQVYDAQTGEAKRSSLVNWNTDISKKLPAKQRVKYEEMYVTMHRMIFTENGKVYAMGEQFKRSINPYALGGQMLGVSTSISNIQIDIHDMMVFEFDSTLRLDKVHVVEKNMSEIWLPERYEWARGQHLAAFLKLNRKFDHCYTSITGDRTNFNCVYKDYAKKKGESGKYEIGFIGLNESLELTTDIYKLTEEPDEFYVLQAKPGYVAIVEFYKEDKRMSIRLEKSDLK